MARAMIAKLDGFDDCAAAMEARDADALKGAIAHMNEGWWKTEHWCACTLI